MMRDLVAIVPKSEKSKIAIAFVTLVCACNNRRDRDGKPSYFHPVRVALQQKTPQRMIVALLHDLVEDTDITLEEIKRDFGAQIALSVYLLTRTKDQPWRSYIRDMLEDEDAVHVKIADIKDNMRRMDEKFRQKLPMYEWGLDRLREARKGFTG